MEKYLSEKKRLSRKNLESGRGRLYVQSSRYVNSIVDECHTKALADLTSNNDRLSKEITEKDNEISYLKVIRSI